MKVVLVGKEFDFGAGDGISRYSAELYRNLKALNKDTETTSVGNTPRPVRALGSVGAGDAEIVHLMYPDAARVRKGNARMVTTWHDNRLFEKYSSGNRSKEKPKIAEMFGFAGSMVRSIGTSNYAESDAILYVSSRTAKEVNAYLKAEGLFDAGKKCYVVNNGVDDAFIGYRIARTARRDFAYVGSVGYLHKNIAGLLRLFNMIAGDRRGRASRLHIFTYTEGAEGIIRRHMEGNGSLRLGENVILHLREPDSEVLKVLPRSVALLHMSMLEGFGMPILEALAVGTPVLTMKGADIPSDVLRHAYSGDYQELFGKAIELLERQSGASREAVRYAKGFSWKANAEKTMKIYDDLL